MSLSTILVNVGLSLLGGYISSKLIKEYIPIFIARRHFGNDQCKVSDKPVPEPMGMISAAVYLIVIFIFIPFPFLEWTFSGSDFPHDKFLAFMSAIISICTAILLGFADDMLDLRWRHKLLFPTLSSLPVLMVYYVSGGSTTIVVPKVVRYFVAMYGFQAPTLLEINFLYYIFMGMVIVFCTNAINIYAGVNGLEVGQSLVISASIICYNLTQVVRLGDPIDIWHNWLSLYFLLPFFTISYVLWLYNKCPAMVFVGDTYCYWAGMTIAVSAILGHFSKTAMLFFMPQSSDLKSVGSLIINLLAKIGLLYKVEFEKDGARWTRVNNFTVINLMLKFVGPVHEATLTNYLLLLQLFFSAVAFTIRFYLATFIYEVVL